jgi:hypothetical protein
MIPGLSQYGLARTLLSPRLASVKQSRGCLIHYTNLTKVPTVRVLPPPANVQSHGARDSSASVTKFLVLTAYKSFVDHYNTDNVSPCFLSFLTFRTRTPQLVSFDEKGPWELKRSPFLLELGL